MSYGGNDETGKVWCNLCDWTGQTTQGMEQIEFVLQRHLREEHGVSALFRVDDKGKVTVIPQ
jgi:hypothetical protein